MAQNKAYDVSKDTSKEENDGSLVFNGPITFNDLDNEPTFATWLKISHEEYKPKDKHLEYLRDHLKDYSLVVFMGTWCDDSHNIVPKLEKMLQLINYPLSTVTMYGVDRAKNTKNGESKTYNISRVPTIIVLKRGKEIGRITETVLKSVEADLSAIIEKDNG